MKKHIYALFIVLCLMFFTSCRISTSTHTIWIAKGGSHSTAMGYYASVDEFIVVTTAEHADSTALYIPDDGVGMMHFYYKPDTAFTGTDYVKLASGYYRSNNKFKIEEYHEFNITVQETILSK